MDEHGTPSDTMGELTPEDAVLLDQLIENGFNPEALEGIDEQTRSRAARLVAVMGLMDDYPVEQVTSDQKESLVAATMARIDRAEAEQQDRMRLDSGGRLPRLRLREFVAIAAVLIFGLAIILPMIRSTSSLENTDVRTARLFDISKALSAFETDHDGQLPSMQLEDAGFHDAIGHSPSMLDISPCGDYGLDENAIDEAKAQFSFHSQQSPKINRVSFPGTTVIISDRNLYLERVLDGESIPDVQLQPLVLMSDGSVKASSCLFSQDHIWDCDRQRKAGKPVIEIFLIHSRGPQGSSPASND